MKNNCPVCGRSNLDWYEICPVCGWENEADTKGRNKFINYGANGCCFVIYKLSYMLERLFSSKDSKSN